VVRPPWIYFSGVVFINNLLFLSVLIIVVIGVLKSFDNSWITLNIRLRFIQTNCGWA